VNYIGPLLRRLGQRLYKFGALTQGDGFQEDRLVPSMRCIPTSKKTFPKLLQSEFIAPNCTIIGDVETQKFSSFFHGVILRGDQGKIRIGKGTIVQDNSILHGSGGVKVGDKVVIGANCTINSCVIEDNAFIGNGATIHEGCVIESGAMVAAGAVVKPGTRIPANQIWAGNPAKYLRDMKADEKVNISELRSELQELSLVMVEECEKTDVEVYNDNYDRKFSSMADAFETMANQNNKWGHVIRGYHDQHGLEAADTGIHGYNREHMWIYSALEPQENLDYNYEFYSPHYPDIFKVYNENYDKYEKLRQKFESEEVPRDEPEMPKNFHMGRPGAMRPWLNKWDPDYNITFKQVGKSTHKI